MPDSQADTVQAIRDYLKRATEAGVGHGFKDSDCPVCRAMKSGFEPSTEAINAAYGAYTELGEDNADAVVAALRAAYAIESPCAAAAQSELWRAAHDVIETWEDDPSESVEVGTDLDRRLVALRKVVDQPSPPVPSEPLTPEDAEAEHLRGLLQRLWSATLEGQNYIDVTLQREIRASLSRSGGG